MTIRRDYQRPFFSNRRRNGRSRFLLLYGLVLGAFLAVVVLRYDDLQLQALDAVGMAPTPTPYASQLAMQALEHYNAGNVTLAVQTMERAVQQRPTDIDYLYEYGRLLLEAERSQDAIVVADRAIEVAPNDPRGYTIKGRALMWTDEAQAIQVSIRGLEADPNFAPLYAIQGVAYTNLGRWQEGMRNGTRAVEIDPTDPFVQRAYFTPLVYVGRFQDAARALETAVSVNPNLTAPYFELAALYRSPLVREPEMAVAIYYHIIEMEPDNAKAYLRLCQTYAAVERARFDVAQPYCDRAIQLDPNYGDAYGQRGMMQYTRRNYEGSIESFERCVELGSNMIECWYIRGFAHYRLDQCEQSWDILQDARVMSVERGLPEITVQIDNVIEALTLYCAGFQNRPMPTAIPPTPIPPTPIGGF